MRRMAKTFGRQVTQISCRSLQTLLEVAQLHGRSNNNYRPRPQLFSKNISKTHFSNVEKPTTKKDPILRWGIAPITLMAEDFATALSVLPKQHHCITSCMDAYRSEALTFADKHQVPNIYTSFEELARCPSVDAVYISPLNPMHCELCHLMLNHDKHVLCEQPLCMAEDQVVQLVAKARARGLFLMEGFWPRCIPAYHFLRREIMNYKLGKIYQVDCQLGWQLPIGQAREHPYGGVAKDLAPYGIQLALWIYREVPQSIKLTGKLNDEGIDVAANVELIFSGNRRARLSLSAEEKLDNKAHIRGTKGSVTMSNTWCPTLLAFENTDFEFVLPEAKQPTYYHNRIGLCYEAQEIRNCILKGRTESDLFSHDESRLMANLTHQIQEMLDAHCLEQELKLKQAVC